MRVIERTIEHPEDEGVILEYVKLTKDFAEIKEQFHIVEQLLAEVEHNRRLKEIVLEKVECDI